MTRTTRWLLGCLFLAVQTSANASEYPFVPEMSRLPGLARQVIRDYHDDDREEYLNNLFRLQIVAEDPAGARGSLQALRDLRLEAGEDENLTYLPYAIFVQAKLREAAEGVSFQEAFQSEFGRSFEALDDRTALQASGRFVYNLNLARRQLQGELEKHRGRAQIGLEDAIALLRRYQPLHVFEQILPLAEAAITADDRRRYTIQDDVLIVTPHGATLSAVVVRPKSMSSPQPTALLFNIYTDLAASLYAGKLAAARGYVGVVADVRGKRLSPDEIVPYEHDANDTHAVIDWISRQSWSDGSVGMFGGSYNGFTQWAATKRLHPALKTIVPMVAAVPGLGLPMWNNVFTNANYGWTFFVTNNKELDHEVYRDRERWNGLAERWFASGRPYRDIDRIDGTPNPLLQRWLEHPAYDTYWQGMVPFGSEFAIIDVPILSITGYFDDGQGSALHYVREHYRHKPDADHYLVIGPYDHWGAQARPAPVVRDYRIDPVAHLDMQELTFQWLDHVLRGGPRPDILKDKINFQVMGSNAWRHVASLDEMASETLTLYLSSATEGEYRRLSRTRAPLRESVLQEVDLADRAKMHNAIYPDPVTSSSLDLSNGVGFISEPFDGPVEVNGSFSGVLRVTINKQDMDVAVALYAQLPDGTYFYLSHFLGRASYANDMTRRQLLKPGTVESIPIQRTIMTSRRLEKGSRVVAVLNVNKNDTYQVNYGTGRDVSDESIEDAGTPLRIEWHDDSYLELPVRSLGEPH